MIRRLCVIGVGLIGGSLTLALRRAGAVDEIVGAGRDESHLRRAVELGVIDRFEIDAGRAVVGADLTVVAVPLGAMRAVFAALKDHLAQDAVLTDVGSAKHSVIEAARNVFGELPTFFVPGHPIAGTEHSGVEAAFAELYRGRKVILTPVVNTDRKAMQTVKSMWAQAGATVEEMDVEYHDRVLAATSHLPHVLAYALVESLSRLDDRDEIFRHAAGGFKDFTRIASSDPVMWRDILLANGDAIRSLIGRYRDDLARIEDAILREDGPSLQALFARAKQARDGLAIGD
ncbi:MAG: prephenate dehydrogenase/arogenate dehydrogenase family protein [Gammaproteobacteria bacterium]|nr:prephenate dehydrogenase/arogenate dehydrogenase family protein [Gammaproteobacteria bacterium]